MKRQKVIDPLQVALTCPTCSFSYLIKKTAAILGQDFCHLHVAQFGAVWNKEFRQLWQDPNCSIERIRAKMGFPLLPYCLLFQAAEECGLPLDRGGLPVSRKLFQRYLRVAQQKQDRLVQAKESLSKLRASNPKLGHRGLQKLARADYSFAYSYDRRWFAAMFGRKNRTLV